MIMRKTRSGLFNRHNIGIATFINLFLLGYITQFSLETLQGWFPAPGPGLRVLFLAVGIVVICIGSALYMTADLGVSTYDAVTLIWSERQKKIPFSVCRIIGDLTCVLLGIILCLTAGFSIGQIPEVVGIGTIITAFFMGPLISLFNRKIAEPFLSGK